jgi:plastocyanin
MLLRILLFFLLFAQWMALDAAEHGNGHLPTHTTVDKNPPTDENGVVLISIHEFKYIPAHFEVNVGTTVRWINQEKRQYHNVWFKQLGEPEPAYLFPEDVYERVFDTVGVFPYRCGPHPEMTGEVVVGK